MGIKHIALILLAAVVIAGVSIIGWTKRGVESTENEVVLYNWKDYFDPNTKAAFEKETGIKLIIKEYETVSEAVSEIQSNFSQYDLVIAEKPAFTGFMCFKPFDRAKLPHINNLISDPGQQIDRIPYLFGLTGLGINTKYVSADTNSWTALYDPRYKGKVMLLDDDRDAVIPLLMLSRHLTGENDANKLAQMKDIARRIHDNGVAFDETYAVVDALKSGEKWVAMVYNGDLEFKAGDDPNLKFVAPIEGLSESTDCFMLIDGAKHPNAAHKLVDFMLRPENSARTAQREHYLSPVKGVENCIENPSWYKAMQQRHKSYKQVIPEQSLGHEFSMYERLFYILKGTDSN